MLLTHAADCCADESVASSCWHVKKQTPTRSPGADVQMCSVYFAVEKLAVQLKRSLFASFSPPSPHLVVPDVVKNVKLKEEKNQIYRIRMKIMQRFKGKMQLLYCSFS